MLNLFSSVFALLVFYSCDAGNVQLPHFEENYLVGMRAYTEEQWEQCTEAMQQAVEDYERYTEGSVGCLRLCESQEVSTLYEADANATLGCPFHVSYMAAFHYVVLGT